MPDVVEKLWHFWVGDASEGGHIIDHVLCMTRANWHDKTRDGTINVTINADEVTCQECLEWLHA